VPTKWKQLWLVPAVLISAEYGFAAGAAGHSDPIAPTLLAIFVVLLAAQLGGELFERCHCLLFLESLLRAWL
jgi:hypothetical protein